MIKKQLLLIISILVYNFGFAQKVKWNYESQPIYVYIDSVYIKTYVKVDLLPEKFNLKKKYTWYASNQILETQGGASGKLVHGKYESSYPNKNLFEKGIYKDGLRVGKWIKWYPNGNINTVIKWRKGWKKGKFYQYFPNGKVMIKGRYRKDKLNGCIKEYDAKGNIRKTWFRRGDIIIKKQTTDTLKASFGKNIVDKPHKKFRLKEKITSLKTKFIRGLKFLKRKEKSHTDDKKNSN